MFYAASCIPERGLREQQAAGRGALTLLAGSNPALLPGLACAGLGGLFGVVRVHAAMFAFISSLVYTPRRAA